MSTVKVLISLIVIIVAATGAFAFYGLYNLDILIRQNIITIGSEATQSPVKLNSANFSLRSGLGRLKQLQISNPEGFNSAYALTAKYIDVTIDPKSIMNDVIVIENISINNASLIAEEQGYKTLNLHQLHQNINHYLLENTEQSSSVNPKRYVIENISLTNSNLRLVTEKFGDKVIEIPALAIKDISQPKTGLSAQQLAPAILNPILDHATGEVKSVLSQLTGSHGKDALKKMADSRLELEQQTTQ